MHRLRAIVIGVGSRAGAVLPFRQGIFGGGLTDLGWSVGGGGYMDWGGVVGGSVWLGVRWRDGEGQASMPVGGRWGSDGGSGE